MPDLKSALLFLVAMLVLAWMWGQCVEYLDWKIRQRRSWRTVDERIRRDREWRNRVR